MAVVPGYEIGGRRPPWQVGARNGEFTVLRRPHRVDDGVVIDEQILVGDVLADLDAQVEFETGLRGDLVEQPRDLPRLLVVGCNAESRQPVRLGKAVVDVDVHARLREQFVCGVHRRWPGPDDRDSKRLTLFGDGGCRGHWGK